MRKIYSMCVCISIILALFMIIDLGFEIKMSAMGDVITVDDDGGADYTSLQDAVNDSQDGDIIYVYAGDYYGSVTIQKSITIIGENRETTKVHGGGPGNEYVAILIGSATDNVTLQELYIISSNRGIDIWDSTNISILHCKFYGANYAMIYAHGSSDIFVDDTIFEKEGESSNDIYASGTDNFTIRNSVFRDWWIYLTQSKEVLTGGFLLSGSNVTALNTSFAKNEPYLYDPSNLTVQWFLTVSVEDDGGTPVEGATVVTRNKFGQHVNTSSTGANGRISDIIVTEYVQNSSKKKMHTPHNITAVWESEIGYAVPEPSIAVSKEVTIIIYNRSSSISLEHGSNFISINRIQSATDIQTVLQSIDGQYRAVQWYNSSDQADPWKNYHASKPPYMNDLSHLNHMMGFWICIDDLGVAPLVFNGTYPSTPQSIPLRKGWNMVGYPSLSNKYRPDALNNLVFGTDVDAVWTYNSGAQKWEEVGDLNYFVVGKGYWIHATQDCVWEVPL